MNVWDEARWSEMRSAQSALNLNFKELEHVAGRPFPAEAQEDIRNAAERFIEDAFGASHPSTKREHRLCAQIADKIARVSSGPITQGQTKALHRLLERADREGLVLPHGEVQRALRRFPDPDYLQELRAAAERRINPQVIVNARILKIEVDMENRRIVIESENPQKVDAGFPHAPGAKGYLPYRLFSRALYRIYREAGGTARYSYPYEYEIGKGYSGEAINFIMETVAQTCAVMDTDRAAAVCPSDQARAIALAIDEYFQEET